eukprot:2548-Heterococcus_DN1.PRE.1
MTLCSFTRAICVSTAPQAIRAFYEVITCLLCSNVLLAGLQRRVAAVDADFYGTARSSFSYIDTSSTYGDKGVARKRSSLHVTWCLDSSCMAK